MMTSANDGKRATRLTYKLTALTDGVKQLLQDNSNTADTNVDGPEGPSNVAVQPKTFPSSSYREHLYVDVAINGNENDIWRVKAYTAHVFAEIRQVFGVSRDMYEKAFDELPKFGVGKGKSGAKLFLTNDKNFIVKTMTQSETKLFCRKYVPAFYKFLEGNHGNGGSLLPQFMGVYRCKRNRSRNYYVLIRNVFPKDYPIKCKYDLKGCFVDRKTTDHEKRKTLPTLKDQDFLDDQIQVRLSENVYTKLVSILDKDVEFLRGLNLMDYSLLLGIHKNTDDVTIPESYYRLNSGEGSDVTYFAGIIDVLTVYNMKKKMAHGVKVIKNKSTHPDISTVNAHNYATRFLLFMKDVVFVKT